MQPHRVLIHGDLLPFTGAWSYAQAFQRAGHAVDSLGSSVALEKYQFRLAFRIYARLFHTILEFDRKKHVRQLLSKVAQFQPTILMALGGHHLPSSAIGQLRTSGVWTVNVNHDDFFSQYRSNWTWTQRKAIPAYNQILTTRTVNVPEIRPLNPAVCFFPFSYDPNVHCPTPIPSHEGDKWQVDVVFVGQWAAHRASLLEILVEKCPARYAIHGPHWDKLPRTSPVRKYVQGSHIWGSDMAKALGGAKLALGFLRKENRDDYTQRTFEIPACGGVLVAERTARHQSLFQEGVEAEFFDSDSPTELVDKVQSLLSNEPRRKSIRQAGMAALRRGANTYDHRIAEILSLYERQRSES